VAQAAAITRRSAAAILGGIRPDKFALFKENPEEFIAKAGRIITSAKAAMIADHVEYHTIDGTYDSEIFSERMPQDISRALEAQKNVQDYVFPDSQGEREFAQELEAHEEVVVYAKLPRSFKIPTPVGNYAPDWTIAFKEGAVKHIYFVAETKGAVEELDLRGVENAKIACARKLFNKINTSEIRYDSVDSYQKMLTIINGLD
jgi:type III restriction enzyme